MTADALEIPLKLLSLNATSGHHWRERHARAKLQRQDTHFALMTLEKPLLPTIVTITRVAPRPLDSHDNLPGACKHVVDGVADWLGIKDDSPLVTWRYAQAVGKPKQYAARIHFRHTADSL